MQAPFRNDNWKKCRAMAHLQGKNNGWKDTSSKGEEFCHTGSIHHCSKTHQQTKPWAYLSLHVMPFPVANLRQVLPIFSDVFLVFDALVADRLLGVGGNRAQAHSVDHVRDKVKAIHIIEKDHIERRRGGPFFLVAAHVEIAVIGPSIR